MKWRNIAIYFTKGMILYLLIYNFLNILQHDTKQNTYEGSLNNIQGFLNLKTAHLKGFC